MSNPVKHKLVKFDGQKGFIYNLKIAIAKARHLIWSGSVWRKAGSLLIAVFVAFSVASYSVAQWYINKHANQPLTLGASFIADYARNFSLDPKQTLEAMLADLNLKQVRLVSYWKNIESQQGKYDFSDLDWQFELANKYGADVSLAIGLRQPRWPECHEPDWAKNQSKDFWQPKLYAYMEAVVDRYKNNPALQGYELENEFFMKVCGKCTDFDRQRLIEEYKMVKSWDPNHEVIVSRSDNWIGIPIGEPKPDKYAISIYKRVWDAIVTHRYFEYPLPPWFYASLAGWGELFNDRDMVVHELQAEPWPPKGMELWEAPLTEQYKSMDAKRFKDRINYGIDTGMRTLDLWGAEWWYWLKEKHGDDSVWQVAKEAIAKAEIDNQKLADRD
ncbi:hypothetical protein A3J32_02720 [Candidatus Saccharibacteria bacterium RIFCSPLOWO2_02_FULL_46_7]|nr:MAG: hypothetical protein A3J32_02720 [Candidatus Saccharibacteria bacterium RIFCSPLOWO2_02_FULL_46_7]